MCMLCVDQLAAESAPPPAQAREPGVADRELGMEEIPEVIGAVWGWTPSSAQVSRWLRMQGCPIPTIRSQGSVSARYVAVREWAIDHERHARGGRPR
jgi:hypothetical protein